MKRKYALSVLCAFMIILCVRSSVSASSANTSASTKSEALKAYASMLEKSEDKNYSFALCFIDNNNIPELCVYDKTKRYQHRYGLTYIYTYYQGKLLKLGRARTKYFRYVKKTGLYEDPYASEISDYRYYTLKNGKSTYRLKKTLIYTFTAGDYKGPNPIKKYRDCVKKKAIKAKAFQKKLAGLKKGKQFTKVKKYYSNNAEMRLKILK